MRAFQSLPELLAHRAGEDAAAPAAIFVADDERETTLTYAELYRLGQRCAAGLAARGVKPGARVMLMLPDSKEFVIALAGTWLCGAVATPTAAPAGFADLEGFRERLAAIHTSCQPQVLVAFKGAARAVGPIATVLTLDELLGDATLDPVAAPAPDETCLLQYTSGSTGMPKGVELTHSNLLANVGMIAEGCRARREVTVSWLPLYHDMGLIGGLLTSFYTHTLVVLLSPLLFIRKPQAWLWAIHRHRGTVSPAPNFSYQYCLKRIADEQVRGLDLSSWRVAFNGAEPVDAEIVTAFHTRFASYGLRAHTVMPVYGLAEATLAVSFSEPEAPLIVERAAETVAVCVGRALPGLEIAIFDARDKVVPDRTLGEVCVRGPSIMKGYWQNPAGTAHALRDGWLHTGDLGYLAEGRLFIAGRSKDIIIVNGQNYFPQDFERAVESVAGIRKGRSVAFARTGDNGTEEVVVLAETREGPGAHAELVKACRAAVSRQVGFSAHAVELLAPGTLRKTSSGKIRRADNRRLYLAGALRSPKRSWLRHLVRWKR